MKTVKQEYEQIKDWEPKEMTQEKQIKRQRTRKKGQKGVIHGIRTRIEQEWQ
jgi:hypothetical protein